MAQAKRPYAFFCGVGVVVFHFRFLGSKINLDILVIFFSLFLGGGAGLLGRHKSSSWVKIRLHTRSDEKNDGQFPLVS